MDASSEKERFIGIVQDHKRILFKVINSYCQDPEDRKDLEQEIMIQLWKSLKHFQGGCRLSTWVYKISLNVALSFYSRDTKKRLNNTALDESIFQLAAEEESEEFSYRTELLHNFIHQLNPFDRAIILLYLEENSYKEIAEVLGISESNVGTKINRIKKKLQESFALIKN